MRTLIDALLVVWQISQLRLLVAEPVQYVGSLGLLRRLGAGRKRPRGSGI